MKIIPLLFLLMAVLSSCKSSSYFFRNERFQDLENFTLQKAIAYEKKIGAKDISPNHMVRIGDGIYPNEQHFVLGSPKWFTHKRSYFEVQTNYYFLVKDSSIKVVLYEWNYSKPKKDIFRTASEADLIKHNNLYQKQFEYLTYELTRRLGPPTETNIEQNQPNIDTFRDDRKWERDGLHAYLFMFGHKPGYRQIRLAVYQN